ncbi:hypothetical protein AB0B94_30605 [Micromonospora sp. NPDC048986]|uniref:hypothetical protein n=1 Tax=Micromonospora sp. NPDC048986 TaxID=3155644 RepID=UPI0033CEA003
MSAPLKLTAKQLHDLGYFLAAVTKATNDYNVRLDAYGPFQVQIGEGGPTLAARWDDDTGDYVIDDVSGN